MNRRTFLGAASLALAPVSIAAAHDPLLETIREYQKQMDVFGDIPRSEITKDNEKEIWASTVGPHYHKLLHETPETTSLEGVREAMRLCFHEEAFECQISENAIRSALAYLETI